VVRPLHLEARGGRQDLGERDRAAAGVRQGGGEERREGQAAVGGQVDVDVGGADGCGGGVRDVPGDVRGAGVEDFAAVGRGDGEAGGGRRRDGDLGGVGASGLDVVVAGDDAERHGAGDGGGSLAERPGAA